MVAFKGVTGFGSKQVGPGVHKIAMYGSEYHVDDYTDGQNLEGKNLEKIVKLRNISKKVPLKYKEKFMCKQYAKSMKDNLMKEGINGEVLTVKTGTGFIESDTFGNISTDGIHQAVKVDDMVFDNLRPDGLSYDDWINDLGGPTFTNPPHALITSEIF